MRRWRQGLGAASPKQGSQPPPAAGGVKGGFFSQSHQRRQRWPRQHLHSRLLGKTGRTNSCVKPPSLWTSSLQQPQESTQHAWSRTAQGHRSPGSRAHPFSHAWRPAAPGSCEGGGSHRAGILAWCHHHGTIISLYVVEMLMARV